MVKAKVNELTYMHFTVFDTDGITPLTGQAGACTEQLRKDGANTGEAVTILETPTNTGRYYATFTPLAVADYDLEVTCPDDRVVGETFEVELHDLDDLADDISTVDGKIDGIVTNVLEILYLSGQKNTVVENTFDGTNKHTGFLMYCYNSIANKQLNDHVTGLLYKYQLDVTYDVNLNPTEIGLEVVP